MKEFTSFLSEMRSLFLRIGSRLPCHGHRLYRSTRDVWKARVWLAATHYIEIHRLNLTSNSELIENIGRNIFIHFHGRRRDPFVPTKFSNLGPEILVEWIAPIINWSKNSLLVCNLIKLLFARIHNFRASYFR